MDNSTLEKANALSGKISCHKNWLESAKKSAIDEIAFVGVCLLGEDGTTVRRTKMDMVSNSKEINEKVRLFLIEQINLSLGKLEKEFKLL